MSSNTTLIITLNNISHNLNQYFGIIIFLFGTNGNILNIFVLFQRSLRSNPCALLFLVSSISNLITILSGLTSRIAAGWDIDPTSTVLYLCKLRIFTTFASRTAAYWFITLASIDRWLLSSVHVHRRQMSTMKNTRRYIITISAFSIILFIQAPICFEINPNKVSFQCHGKTKECRMSVDLTYGFITIFLPILLMNIFSLMTILNVRRTKSSMQLSNRQINNNLPVIRIRIPNQQWKKTDQRLLMMLFTQIILFTFFTFPLAIQRIYITMTMNNNKSDLENTVDDFIYNLTILLSFIANGIPFYIFTLTGGKIFRKALLNVIRCVY